MKKTPVCAVQVYNTKICHGLFLLKIKEDLNVYLKNVSQLILKTTKSLTCILSFF